MWIPDRRNPYGLVTKVSKNRADKGFVGVVFKRERGGNVGKQVRENNP